MLVVIIGVPLVAFAEMDESVVVGSDEIISDNFVRYADNITIEGRVEGDAIVGGGQVTIDGTVAGDAIIAGGSIVISGNVLGNARIIGSSVTIRGQIGKNATVVADNLTVTDRGSIGWSFGFVGGNVEVMGPVYGNITGYALGFRLGSSVGSNVRVRVTGKNFQLTDDATIGGNLMYVSNEAVEIESGQITGTVEHKQPSESLTDIREIFVGSVIFLRIASLLGLLLVGLVIISFFPKKTKKIIEDMNTNPFSKISWGIVYLIGIPLATIILFISLIGFPLAIIVLVLYSLLLYLSRIYIGLLIGQKILGLFLKDKTITPLVPMVLGVLVFVILTWLPFIGIFISLAGIVWSLSSLIRVGYKDIKQYNFSTADKKN